MTYRQLDAEKTISTLDTLQKRVEERFGGAGLCQVAKELCDIARESQARIAWIDRPHFGLRLTVISLVVLGLALAAVGVEGMVQEHQGGITLSEGIGMLEAGTNEVIVIGAALLFLFSLEVRVKRTRALRVLHDLRAISHVIDMHQLTKDPGRLIGSAAESTPSSPKRILTPFQLTRYLDYCSEMLSLVGKLAALYAQSLPDPVVVGAVNDIETLTNGLSRKIWQKIVIINDTHGPDHAEGASAAVSQQTTCEQTMSEPEPPNSKLPA